MKGLETELELFDGSVSLRGVRTYRCPACGEDLFTSEQGEDARRELAVVAPVAAFRARRRVRRVGNSLLIPLPKDIADLMQVGRDSEVVVSVKDRHRLIMDAG
jgi:hypothetical protein